MEALKYTKPCDWLTLMKKSIILSGTTGRACSQGFRQVLCVDGRNDRIILSDVKRKPSVFSYCVIAIYSEKTQ